MTVADTLCRSTSKRITTTAFRQKDPAGSSRERKDVTKESRRMLQAERLRVAVETLHQVYEEIVDGRIDDAQAIKTLAATISITANNIQSRIYDKEADNEDS